MLARGADWVLLLNDDIIVDAEAVASGRIGESDPRVGVVGPMVLTFDELHRDSVCGGGMTGGWDSFHFGQNEDDRGSFAVPRQVAWIPGAADVSRHHGPRRRHTFDERFFLYWEETEWCLRAGSVTVEHHARAGSADLAQGVSVATIDRVRPCRTTARGIIC